jgi:hypothetical protein
MTIRRISRHVGSARGQNTTVLSSRREVDIILFPSDLFKTPGHMGALQPLRLQRFGCVKTPARSGARIELEPERCSTHTQLRRALRKAVGGKRLSTRSHRRRRPREGAAREQESSFAKQRTTFAVSYFRAVP